MARKIRKKDRKVLAGFVLGLGTYLVLAPIRDIIINGFTVGMQMLIGVILILIFLRLFNK